MNQYKPHWSAAFAAGAHVVTFQRKDNIPAGIRGVVVRVDWVGDCPFGSAQEFVIDMEDGIFTQRIRTKSPHTFLHIEPD